MEEPNQRGSEEVEEVEEAEEVGEEDMATAVTRIEKLPGLNAAGPRTVKDLWPLYDTYADTPSAPPVLRKRTSAFYPLAKRAASLPKREPRAKKTSSTSSTDYAKLSLILGVVSAIGGAAYIYWKYKETQARHEYRNRELDAFHALQKSTSLRPHATTGYPHYPGYAGYGWE